MIFIFSDKKETFSINDDIINYIDTILPNNQLVYNKMIIPYSLELNNNNLPDGWALCNGKKYILNNNKAVESLNGYQTPNLIGYFIMYNPFKYIGYIDGESGHLLTINEMASHTHSTNNFLKWGGSEFGFYTSSTLKYLIDGDGQIGNTGGNNKHNNIPPYCALVYIIKL